MPTLDIIWDIDGVLSDFTFGFKEFARQNGYMVPLAPTGAKKSWQFRHLARAEEDDLWRRIAEGQYDWSLQPSLLSTGDLFAINVLRTTMAADVRYQYVTSRLGPEEQVVRQTVRWLHATGLPDYGNVIVSNDKVSAIHKAGFNVGALIDDDIRNIAAYRDVYDIDRVFLRDWQYNRADEVGGVYGVSAVHGAAISARRVSSVAEFCFAVLEGIDGVDRG